jgi:hypothetical protein
MEMIMTGLEDAGSSQAMIIEIGLPNWSALFARSRQSLIRIQNTIYEDWGVKRLWLALADRERDPAPAAVFLQLGRQPGDAISRTVQLGRRGIFIDLKIKD